MTWEHNKCLDDYLNEKEMEEKLGHMYGKLQITTNPSQG